MQSRFTIACLFDEKKSDAGGIVAAPTGSEVLAMTISRRRRRLCTGVPFRVEVLAIEVNEIQRLTERRRNFLKYFVHAAGAILRVGKRGSDPDE
jgi:hypothetical protein